MSSNPSEGESFGVDITEGEVRARLETVSPKVRERILNTLDVPDLKLESGAREFWFKGTLAEHQEELQEVISGSDTEIAGHYRGWSQEELRELYRTWYGKEAE